MEPTTLRRQRLATLGILCLGLLPLTSRSRECGGRVVAEITSTYLPVNGDTQMS